MTVKQIDGQINIFDILYQEFNPLKALVKRTNPYWTTSKKAITDAVRNGLPINKLTKIVKEQYCPYGYAGGYYHNHRQNEIDEYVFKNSKIYIVWTGKDHKSHEQYFTYQEFAKEIQKLVHIGDYK